MTLMFLVAGLLTPPSLERKGTARFVRYRLLRRGLPVIAYVVLVQPVMYALEHPLGKAPGSYWPTSSTTRKWWIRSAVLRGQTADLLARLCRLVWAGHASAEGRGRSRITVGRLLFVAAVVAPASLLIRLVYPYGSDSASGT